MSVRHVLANSYHGYSSLKIINSTLKVNALSNINSLMTSALIPAFSNSGATCFMYTSRAWPFLLLGLITTFNLRGLLGMSKTNKEYI